MSVYQFKTSINCGNCVNLVKMYMEEVPNLEQWNVETTNPDKILTVSGNNLSADAVVEKVQEAGFTIVPLG
jgi:copper chaperone